MVFLYIIRKKKNVLTTYIQEKGLPLSTFLKYQEVLAKQLLFILLYKVLRFFSESKVAINTGLIKLSILMKLHIGLYVVSGYFSALPCLCNKLDTRSAAASST